MDFEFGFPILFFIILIAIIVGIVAVVRRAGDDNEAAPGIGTTRRLFMYGLAFLALMLATSGVTMLVSSILDTLFNDEVFRRDSGRTAFGLAAAIVGFPIWALLWRASARSLETYPGEAGTFGRKLYVYSVLMVSAVVVAFSATSALRELLGVSGFEASSLATPLVWAALWAVHWRWERSEGQPTEIAVGTRRIYVYLTSAYGLVLLASGIGTLLFGLLDAAYDALFQASLARGGADDLWNDATQGALATGVIGASWWWFHWHRATEGDHSSGGRLAIVYVLGIFGGTIVAVIGVSTFIFTILDWLLDRGDVTAAAHFDLLPGGLTLALVGTAVWTYHRLVAESDAEADAERAASAARVYRYLSAAVGLGALAFGLTVEIGLGVGLLADAGGDIFRDGRWWATPLAFSLTAIVVGAALWGRHWVVRQTRADAADPAERTAQSRRTYMFSVFGIAVLATLIAASIVLFQVLRALLDGDLRAEVFDDVKYGIGVVVAAGVISGYHWRVLKEDREVEAAASGPEPSARVRKHVTAVAVGGARAVIASIEAKSAMRFTVWQRQDDAGVPVLNDAQVDDVVDRIAAAPGARVLLLIDATGVHVIPL